MSFRPRFVGFVLFTLGLGASAMGCGDPEDDELSADQSVELKKKPQRFTVVQHNVGGGAENGGTGDALRYTFSMIDEQKPDVVMLQEMCLAQVEAFTARYPSWDYRHTVMRETHDGCGGASKGTLLASPRQFVDDDTFPLLEQDGDKVFHLTCGGVPMPKTARSVFACVTHMRVGTTDPDGSARTRQVGRIVAAVKPQLARGREVVIGGDLNVGPDKPVLDGLYRLTVDGNTNGGRFDEADQTDPRRADHAKRGVRCAKDACRSGADTTANTKLDYVFFSRNRAESVGAQAFGFGGSAHKVYVAWADLAL